VVLGSVVVLLFGIAVLVFGIVNLTTNNELKGDYANFGVGVGSLSIVAGVLCIVTGMLGLLSAKFKKFFLTIPFILLALAVLILMFIATAFMGVNSD
jgi:hypothetical protein